MTRSQLVTELMNLPDNERAELALALLRSLGGGPGGEPAADQADWTPAWEAELTRRLEGFRSGTSKGIPADEVFAELRERIEGDR